MQSGGSLHGHIRWGNYHVAFITPRVVITPRCGGGTYVHVYVLPAMWYVQSGKICAKKSILKSQAGMRARRSPSAPLPAVPLSLSLLGISPPSVMIIMIIITPHHQPPLTGCLQALRVVVIPLGAGRPRRADGAARVAAAAALAPYLSFVSHHHPFLLCPLQITDGR